MNILFVCKWNRFRSKAAEAIFNKVNTNNNFHAKSAGFFPGVPVSEDIVKAGKNIGVEINGEQSEISHNLAMWSDYIIIVAEDVPEIIFDDFANNDGKKVLHWKMKDIIGTDVKKREKIMLQIQEKILEFLEENS